ncbi:AAA family ATPase [Streptomyces phaeochromogenes]|uniref:AAA family ATPase n=1 Tax=Streptomyces phaeochromogenes TaxID=1923 RepID=UPI0036C197ED
MSTASETADPGDEQPCIDGVNDYLSDLQAAASGERRFERLISETSGEMPGMAEVVPLPQQRGTGRPAPVERASNEELDPVLVRTAWLLAVPKPEALERIRGMRQDVADSTPETVREMLARHADTASRFDLTEISKGEDRYPGFYVYGMLGDSATDMLTDDEITAVITPVYEGAQQDVKTVEADPRYRAVVEDRKAQEPAREAIPKTWQAQDLEDVLSGTYQPPRPTVGRRDDGVGLFYPGRTNTVISETEGGKTWLALTVALQEMNAGNHVIYVDFEDDRGGVVGRLLVLGGAADVIRSYFHYVRPENRPTPADLVDLAQLLALKPTLAVVDGVTEAMTLYGQDIIDNTGTAAFGRELLRPLKNSGAAVVTLDHVVKDREKQGRNPIGAVHKINGLDGVLYMLECIKPIGIGLTGKTRIRIGKDRPGQIRRHGLPDKSNTFWIMDMVITSHDETFAEVNLYVPNQQSGEIVQSDSPDAEAKAEAEIREREEKALAVLRKAKQPLSGRAVEELVQGRASVTRRALTRLTHAGTVATAQGPRGATLYSLPDPTP